MNKTRAEPGKHRLNCFMEWSREMIANNACVDRDGSQAQRIINNRKKGGENGAKK